MNATGIFGGTFDPIHYGHLRTGFELMQAAGLAEMRFIPAGRPPHRDVPLADTAVRLAMVRAAVEGQPGFVVDDREVRRPGPSYAVTTLEELKAEAPARTLCLALGMDAFLGLDRWHRWREILDLAHVLVAHRPGWHAPAEGPVATLLAERGTRDPSRLAGSAAGLVYVHAVTQLEISSTDLRNIVTQGRDPRYLVPETVRRVILETGCYSTTTQR
ncbi:MAG: nicotinate-nucleotide adenylyltransferase [Steroidobacteraceae bacterium]